MTIAAWVLVIFYLEGGVMIGQPILSVPTYRECMEIKQATPPPPEGAQLMCWPSDGGGASGGAKARPAGGHHVSY